MNLESKTNQNILSFLNAALHLLNSGKIQILIFHEAKAIKISIFLDLLTVLLIVLLNTYLDFFLIILPFLKGWKDR